MTNRVAASRGAVASGSTPEGAATSPAERRVYDNPANPALCALLGSGARRVLDVGCGAGQNAAWLRHEHPGVAIVGITRSAAEAEQARRHLDRCWVLDLEEEFPAELEAETFDAILCSHVLEHLREPSLTLARLARRLAPGGCVLIAVPNVLGWRQRLAFLRGRFEYTEDGVLDSTHLRFFTYHTAGRYLLADAPDLRLEETHVTGSVPLWGLRRHVLPVAWSAGIDALGCRLRPNLFGTQVLLKASKR
jgi:2-polyprenyl-3-methyl-5-hydroxy-6-metoxy-1,4-benzoquinol methylase